MVQNGRGTRPPAWLLAWLGALPIALGRNGQLGDSDTFWQIRTGKLILREHRIPTADPFS
jgi:hypothetical protein